MSSPEIEEPGYVPIREHFQQWLAERRAAQAAPATSTSISALIQARAIPAGFITEEEFARQVNRRVSTVRRWRKAQPPFGPPAARIGNEFYYRETAVREFFDALMQKAEASREEPRKRGRPRRA